MGCFRIDSGAAGDIFVFNLLQTWKYRYYISVLLAGSSINNLKPSDIEKIEFNMPTLNEQVAISGVLSDMDAEITTLERRREKTRAIKQGMMQELLTGRIRLI
jgi:type I restriction enzyme S subunit